MNIPSEKAMKAADEWHRKLLCNGMEDTIKEVAETLDAFAAEAVMAEQLAWASEIDKVQALADHLGDLLTGKEMLMRMRAEQAMNDERFKELREASRVATGLTYGEQAECLDAIEVLTAEGGATLNRLQAAHEERDALMTELVAQRENEHSVMADLLTTRNERDALRARLAEEGQLLREAYERGMAAAVHAVNAVQDKLPSDRKPDGSFDWQAAMFQPKLRAIWWECRQAVLDLLPDPNQLTVREAAEYLRISRSWLYAAINGPTKTRIGGKVFYLKADLDAYLQACREVRCPSTSSQLPQSGGVSFTSPGSVIVAAQAKPIALRLRERSAAYEARLSKTPPSNAGE